MWLQHEGITLPNLSISSISYRPSLLSTDDLYNPPQNVFFFADNYWTTIYLNIKDVFL